MNRHLSVYSHSVYLLIYACLFCHLQWCGLWENVRVFFPSRLLIMRVWREAPSETEGDEQAGEAPCDTMGDEQAGEAPRDTVGDEHAGEAPRDTVCDELAGEAPRDTVCDEQAGEAPRDTVGDCNYCKKTGWSEAFTY